MTLFLTGDTFDAVMANANIRLYSEYWVSYEIVSDLYCNVYED